MPTNTWQAYNFRDGDGNGWGDTWYAKGAQSTATLGRMYIRRGVPPQWRKYDVDFIRWLHATGKQPEFLTETDLESIRTAEELIRLYDFVVFPGHTEYVTRHEYDLMRNYRDLGGNLAFLSANNFFWQVQLQGGPCGEPGSGGDRQAGVVPAWRPVPRQRRRPPSAPLRRPVGLDRALVLGRDRSRRRRHVRPGARRLRNRDRRRGFLDPARHDRAGGDPGRLRPGLTAQMTYYETPQGEGVRRRRDRLRRLLDAAGREPDAPEPPRTRLAAP